LAGTPVNLVVGWWGGAGRGRKLIGRKPVNLIVGWCGRFLFFVVPRQFSQDIGEWPENQILIPDWAYFHCPGATLWNLIPHGSQLWVIMVLLASLQNRGPLI